MGSPCCDPWCRGRWPLCQFQCDLTPLSVNCFPLDKALPDFFLLVKYVSLVKRHLVIRNLRQKADVSEVKP